MSNNFLITGLDSLAIEIETKKVISNRGFNGAVITSYDMEETNLEKPLEDLNTYGLLSDKKVVVITSFDKITGDNNLYLEELVNYVKQNISDNLLIITASKFVVKDNKYLKEMKKHLEVVEVNTNPLSYIKSLLTGYDASQRVINLIATYCDGDITKIYNECEKLKSYASISKRITEEVVEDLVVKKIPDPTELTFSFTRFLAEKNKKEALKLYEEIKACQVEALSLIGLLASQFRIMYQVKVLDRKRYSNSDIARMLDIKEYRITKTRELTRYYSERDILNLIIRLADIDLKIKTTSSDPNLLLQLFIMNIDN